jgi:uncharacterized membrane protein YedE/YeeE
MRAAFVALLGGALFGYGLARSTMISPEVVLSFLRWRDFGLLLVLGGAVAVALPAYQLAPRWMKAPALGGRFGRHAAQLDRATLLGAATFGVGWGLCGVCPGPAIASLGAGNTPTLWALAGIFAGALAQGWLARPRPPAA